MNNKELYLSQIVNISGILKTTKWTKDLGISEGNRIEIKMPVVSTLGSNNGGCYATVLELRNLDNPEMPVKYTTVNNFLNIFPICYNYYI